jgi:hypothetical protein
MCVRKKNGAIRNKNVLICTDNFTIYEVIQIMNIFRVKLRLDCTIHFDNGYPRIYILKNSMATLVKLVNPYIIPSMQYKIRGVNI